MWGVARDLSNAAHLCNVWGVARDLSNVWGVAREVKVQNNARKTDLHDYHVARTLTGWLDIILSFSVCVKSSFSVHQLDNVS